MKIINRDEAIKTLSLFEMKQLPPEKRESILLDWWSLDEEDEEFHQLPTSLQHEILTKEEPSNPGKDSYNPLLEIGITASYKGVKNSYIENKLIAFLKETLKVVGDVDILLPCPCCGFKTLQERGQYEICPVCHWEDDGCDFLDEYSSCNRSTLREAKRDSGKLIVSTSHEKYLK